MIKRKKQRFSLRKLTIGTVSVLLGYTFIAYGMPQSAKADSVTPAENGSENDHGSTALITGHTTVLRASASDHNWPGDNKTGATSETIDDPDVPKPSEPEYSGEFHDFGYEIDTNSNVKINSNNSRESNIVVPNTADFIHAGLLKEGHFAYITSLDELTNDNTHKISISNTDNAKLVVQPDIDPADGAWHLQGELQSNVEEADLNGLDTSRITSMNSSISDVSANLRSLKVNDWDVSNVTNMDELFSQYAGKQLDLSKWNTSKVLSMSRMFADAANLESLDLHNWKVGQVGDPSSINTETGISNGFAYMFENDQALTSLNLSGWQINPQATQFEGMFEMDPLLSNLQINWPNFAPTEEAHLGSLFNGDSSLHFLDLRNWQLPANFNSDNYPDEFSSDDVMSHLIVLTKDAALQDTVDPKTGQTQSGYRYFSTDSADPANNRCNRIDLTYNGTTKSFFIPVASEQYTSKQAVEEYIMAQLEQLAPELVALPAGQKYEFISEVEPFGPHTPTMILMNDDGSSYPDVNPANTEPLLASYQLKLTPLQGQVTITYFDKDNPSRVLGMTSINGDSGSAIAVAQTINSNVPDHWKIDPSYVVPTTEVIPGSVMVPLVHDTTPVIPGQPGVTPNTPAYAQLFHKVVRTIQVQNPVTNDTDTTIETVMFGRTGVKDEVTGELIPEQFGTWYVYNTANNELTDEQTGTWHEFNAPEFTGYIPSQAVVETKLVNVKTPDEKVTITYTKLDNGNHSNGDNNTNSIPTPGDNHPDNIVNNGHPNSNVIINPNVDISNNRSHNYSVANNKQNDLPQTGNSNNALAIAGLGLAGLSVMFGFTGYQKREN